MIKKLYDEYRPSVHYSVPAKWLNDPNGLIYFDGYYHLYYQHHPESTKHGPMHWGHARSKDLLRWEDLPIALYPDEKGVIFSGSMVYDENNTSGMEKDGVKPLVAIFTYHKDVEGVVRQTQGIAFSYDGGMTFEKYSGNPVLDEDRVDFRDPKVIWNEDKWIMPLVAGREVRFYGSKDLINWEFLSVFTSPNEKPSGIWECPDLRRVPTEDGGAKWVLTISVNTGDTSYFGMQYFVGEFDGVKFVADDDQEILIQDMAFDNYAAVSYEGVTDRSLQIGWMNCWYYADRIPEKGFRGSMTIPKEMVLGKRGGRYILLQKPARELFAKKEEAGVTSVGRSVELDGQAVMIEIDLEKGNNQILLKNQNDEFAITVDTDKKKVVMDRSSCGTDEVCEAFGRIRWAKYKGEVCDKLTLIVDTTSVELFTADGEIVGTMQIFIDNPFSVLEKNTDGAICVTRL